MTGQGVNLGGWLVLERWMTPSLFAGVDGKGEAAFCEQLGRREAARRLATHRRTFITEEDIERLSRQGLGLVRVPLGYWLFQDAGPFIGGAARYIDELFRWTSKWGMEVVLDFHAAPGSQNGHDHSGRVGPVEWGRPEHIAASLAFLERLARRYGAEPSLVGIEVLNEPSWEIGVDVLVSYYRHAEAVMRPHLRPGVAIIVSDAYHPLEMSRALRRAGLVHFVLDVHLYQLFTPEDRALDLRGHVRKTKKEWGTTLKKLRRHHPVLIGEWSGAMSELYDPTIGRRKYRPEDYREYIQAQRQVFEAHGTPWTYWTAKTEDGGVWSLLDHPEFLS